ncbi:MAG: hypothetical protein M3P01_12480 [Actinomycetota bacterium]|nr:hypothetical protein [Actinomycetota bacterium]
MVAMLGSEATFWSSNGSSAPAAQLGEDREKYSIETAQLRAADLRERPSDW